MVNICTVSFKYVTILTGIVSITNKTNLKKQNYRMLRLESFEYIPKIRHRSSTVAIISI